MGVKEAIEFLKKFQHNFHLTSIIIETDNSSIVKAIHDRRYPRAYWGHVARKVRELVDENHQIYVHW
ncbi:hypothetical protein A2U01_0061016, partial [Trifolium medium]|nr:hypothetical protein [Trifolium medium]